MQTVFSKKVRWSITKWYSSKESTQLTTLSIKIARFFENECNKHNHLLISCSCCMAFHCYYFINSAHSMSFLSKTTRNTSKSSSNIFRNCMKITMIRFEKLENCSDFDTDPIADALTSCSVLGKSEKNWKKLRFCKQWANWSLMNIINIMLITWNYSLEFFHCNRIWFRIRWVWIELKLVILMPIYLLVAIRGLLVLFR